MPQVEYLSYDIIEQREWSIRERSPFEKAAEADLDGADDSSVTVAEEECTLDLAHREELGWSSNCLKGWCGSCSVAVVDGAVNMTTDKEFLTEEEVQTEDICLPCVDEPETDLKPVYGVRKLDCSRTG